jgi:membrane associated rhomboid family serine protease
MWVPFIISLNVAVYAMWFLSTGPRIEWMYNNFLVSWAALEDGRYWTLLTSAFSHNAFLHLFINMYVLKSFGGLIEKVIGSRRFIVFYLLASIVSSFSHSFVSLLYLNQPEIPALGASGAISGIVILFSLIFPREKILLFGIIPVPALIGAVLFVGLDIWGLTAQAGGGGLPIGHGAHLGGAFTGALFYYFYLKYRLRR